ncbi:hypothetical protein J2S49_000571 [Arcanobacterium wilhelmae]|uniref:DUF8094 domain-containing protein n=1 Tax=Arcanobacterium wilhelmae TaxID=1803177 RepID=A0ABT9N9V7_9ACTO|nr:hypothetical protein [Arcanobacterium wilhelmae]MDP9800495.1 hypothetical protein [Arcanobacterium wilhelmae]
MRKALPALGVAFVMALGACSGTSTGSLPQPKPVNSAAPLMETKAFADTVSATAKELANADKAGSMADATAIANPLRAQRVGEYRLKKGMGDKYTLDPIVLDPKSVPVYSGRLFPRSIMQITAPTDQEKLFTLSVWSAPSAREPITLVADVELFPGVNIGALVSADSTKDGYLGKDSTLAYKPADVVAAYAKYLQDRKAGNIAFAADDQLYLKTDEQLKALSNSIKDLGKASATYAPGDSPVQVVSMEDGGALVVGEIRNTTTLEKTKVDATFTVGGELAGWVNQDPAKPSFEIGKSMATTYSSQVAFYLPPKGKVQVIGASAPSIIDMKVTK